MKRVKSLSALRDYFTGRDEDDFEAIEVREEQKLRSKENPLTFLAEGLGMRKNVVL